MSKADEIEICRWFRERLRPKEICVPRCSAAVTRPRRWPRSWAAAGCASFAGRGIRQIPLTLGTVETMGDHVVRLAAPGGAVMCEYQRRARSLGQFRPRLPPARPPPSRRSPHPGPSARGRSSACRQRGDRRFGDRGGRRARPGDRSLSTILRTPASALSKTAATKPEFLLEILAHGLGHPVSKGIRPVPSRRK